MNRIKAKLFASLALALAASAQYQVGDPTPDFSLTDWNGDGWSLHAQRGKVVVLNFGAGWCGPCHLEFPVLQSEFEEVHDPEHFELVSIDVDGQTASYLHSAWDRYNPTFPILMNGTTLFQAYGDGSIPYNVVIDTEGHVRYTRGGYDPNDRSLADAVEQYLPVERPILEFQRLAVVGDDNLDGRPDGGESFGIQLTLRNRTNALAGTGVSVTLSSDDPDLTILQDTVTFPDMAPGDTLAGDAVFSAVVATGIETHLANLVFRWSAASDSGAATGELAATLRLGRPDLLVVDADAAQPHESYASEALDQLGRAHDLWHVDPATPLTSAEMLKYERIVWLGGGTSGLAPVQRSGLSTFLEQGGFLLLSSQGMDADPGNAQFLAEVFDASIVEPGHVFDVVPIVECAAEDLFFGGAHLVATAGPTGDVLAAGPSATVIGDYYEYTTGDVVGPAAVHGAGAGARAMYFGFPIEGLGAFPDDVPGSIGLADFLQRAFAWDAATAPLAAVTASIEIVGSALHLSWTASPDATAYRVFGLDGFGGAESLLLETTDTEATLPATDGVSLFTVRAVR